MNGLARSLLLYARIRYMVVPKSGSLLHSKITMLEERAILWLTMHIGVMPVELANQEGGLDLSALEELTHSRDQMLFVQTIPLNSNILKIRFGCQESTAGGKTSINDMLGLTRRIPSLRGVPGQIAESSANRLVHQIESFGNFDRAYNPGETCLLFILQVLVLRKRCCIEESCRIRN